MTFQSLRIVDGEAPVLRPGHPAVTSWKDDRGTDVAYVATMGAWHWIEVKGVGSYRFAGKRPAEGLVVEVIPHAGVSREILIDQYFRGVLPYVWHAYGMEALHASAFALAGKTVAMCAERRTGKSTLNFAMAKRGATAIADDAVLLDFGSLSSPASTERDPILVRPVPFEFRLRRKSAEHFSTPDKSQVLVNEDRTAGLAGEAHELSAVILLARQKHGISIGRVTSSKVFTALLEHALVFSLGEKSRKITTASNYLRLARAVPVFRFGFPKGLEHVEEICERLERFVLDLPTLREREAELR